MIEVFLDKSLREVIGYIQLGVMRDSNYFGVTTHKNPLDFWVYREIIVETKPQVIVEIGNLYGGMLLAYAHIFDVLGEGLVIGVDLNHGIIHPKVRAHPRIKLIQGDAVTSASRVRSSIPPGHRTMVIEDSDHGYEKTLAILRAYANLVSPGCYFIIEDGIISHKWPEDYPSGPYEATQTFLKENYDYESDRAREKFLVTWNPGGFLKRLT